MQTLATFVRRMTLGECFSMTTREIRDVMDQFVEKTMQGIELASYRRPRTHLCVDGGVSHGTSLPMAPHSDVAGGSTWHRAKSTLV